MECFLHDYLGSLFPRYYHDQVHSFTDSKSGRCALGLMGQGFVSALKNELTKYYGLVAMLQEQVCFRSCLVNTRCFIYDLIHS